MKEKNDKYSNKFIINEKWHMNDIERNFLYVMMKTSKYDLEVN